MINSTCCSIKNTDAAWCLAGQIAIGLGLTLLAADQLNRPTRRTSALLAISLGTLATIPALLKASAQRAADKSQTTRRVRVLDAEGRQI